MKTILIALIIFISQNVFGQIGNIVERPNYKYKNDSVHLIVNEDPKFEGCLPELLNFISSNIQYPENKCSISGKCYISFIVRKDGEINDVKIQRGVRGCSECDKEAIRVIKMTEGKWSPAKRNGEIVSSICIIPVSFNF